MPATNSRSRAALLAAALIASAQAAPLPEAQRLATDPAAVQQLVSAVSLDVMTEASVEACEAIGAPSAPAARAAWVAWRERHQLAPLRTVLGNSRRRQGSDTLSWHRLIEPMRQRVLAEARPEPVCAGLARDLQTPAMDATALYPLAAPVARALVALKTAYPPDLPAVVPGPPRGVVVTPSQVSALAQASRGEGEVVHVKGWVQRWGSEGDKFELVRTVPGYVTHKGFVADDGERVTIVEFETEEALDQWRRDPEHAKAKRRGIADFFRDYRFQICSVIRERAWTARSRHVAST